MIKHLHLKLKLVIPAGDGTILPDSAIYKPVAIKAYNQHIGGVDRVDQQLHNIQVLKKSYKWYHKLAFCLSIQMILNAHKVYAHETRILFTDFVLEVVKLLVTRASPPPTIIRGPTEENYVRLNGRHFPMLKEASATASNKHPTKVCYAQGKSTTSGLPLRTSYVCGDFHHSQDFMFNTRANTVSKFTTRN